MHDKLALWYVEDGVGHIVLNRPQVGNALDKDISLAFTEAVNHAAHSSDARSLLISARGKHFCVGGDIQDFVKGRDNLPHQVNAVLGPLHHAILTLTRLPQPVVSCVQGALGGAGIAMALCADIVVSSTQMKMRGGYSAIGLSPDLGTSYFLTRRAGAARAKYILMTNKAIEAQQCLEWGLVDELYAPEQLETAARTLALDLARGAANSLAGIKRLCEGADRNDLAVHLDLERQALLNCAATADAREGVTAFVEKRAPQFSCPIVH